MTYLKLEDTTVLCFNFDEHYYEIPHPELLPFYLRDNIHDTTKITDEIRKIEIGYENQIQITDYFSSRSLSVNRENAKYIMNQLHIKQNNNKETRYKVMILCKALSVADNYWLTNDEKERWKDVNLSENPLHKTLQQIALFGRSLTIAGKLLSPELTGQGVYAKAWYRENNILYLYKASTAGGNESEREVLTSEILDCFNVPHVEYTLHNVEGKTVCKCKNMNVINSSIVDSLEFDTWCSKKGLNFIDEARKLDPEMYYKTIVVDYLIANRDRHEGNWGFYMNNKTGKIVGMHPLFDHNNAFDTAFMDDATGGLCQLVDGKNQKEAALNAIKHCDFRCIKPVTKNMFLNEKMYQTFMSRACELGLYKRNPENKLKRFLTGNKEDFIPISIKEDNTKEYWNKINVGLNSFDTKTVQSEKRLTNILDLRKTNPEIFVSNRTTNQELNKDYDFGKER